MDREREVTVTVVVTQYWITVFDLVVLYSAYCGSALFGSNNGLVQAISIIIIRLTKLLSDIAPLVLCLVPSTSTVTVQSGVLLMIMIH